MMKGGTIPSFLIAAITKYVCVNFDVVTISSSKLGDAPPNPPPSPTQAEGKGNAGISHFAPCPLYGGKGLGVRGNFADIFTAVLRIDFIYCQRQMLKAASRTMLRFVSRSPYCAFSHRS